jgi:hypothetical protein
LVALDLWNYVTSDRRRTDGYARPKQKMEEAISRVSTSVWEGLRSSTPYIREKRLQVAVYRIKVQDMIQILLNHNGSFGRIPMT